MSAPQSQGWDYSAGRASNTCVCAFSAAAASLGSTFTLYTSRSLTDYGQDLSVCWFVCNFVAIVLLYKHCLLFKVSIVQKEDQIKSQSASLLTWVNTRLLHFMQSSTTCKPAVHRHNQSSTQLKLAYNMQVTTQEANEAILDKHKGFPRAAYNCERFIHSHCKYKNRSGYFRPDTQRNFTLLQLDLKTKVTKCNKDTGLSQLRASVTPR